MKDPHLNARGAFLEATHPERGTFRQVGYVLAGMVAPEPPVEARDASRTDTDALLSEAGMDASEIASLHAQGIID